MMIWIFVFVLFTLNGCIGTDTYRDEVEPFLKKIEESYKPGVYDGVREPKKFPDLDEDQKSLLGIDSNNDGVRDDIEIYLNRKSKYFYEREIYKNFYRTDKAFYIYLEQKNREGLKDNENERFRILDCYSHLLRMKAPFAIGDASKFNLWEVLFNTKERSSAYEEAGRILAGETYGSGNSTDKQDFDMCPENIKKVYPFKE
jgi:hypothetical protein